MYKYVSAIDYLFKLQIVSIALCNKENIKFIRLGN